MVRLLPFPLKSIFDCLDFIALHSRRRLLRALKYLKHGLAVERQANADLSHVFGKAIFTLTRENRAIFYDSLGIVRRDVLHGDLQVLT